MIHLIPCNKAVAAQQTGQYYVNNVARYHGIPRYTNTDRSTQFTSKPWKELWKLFGTGLKYSTAFHFETQGTVEQMNSVVGYMLRCNPAEANENQNWLKILSIVELAINSSPNKSTGYSPFYLNDGSYPSIPAYLMKTDDLTHNGSVGEFCERMIAVRNKLLNK